MLALTRFTAHLRLHGVKAKEHPVFKELTRVKQYFDKIKTIDARFAERNLVVDKEAAARFIKAGLVSSIPFTFNSTHQANLPFTGR